MAIKNLSIFSSTLDDEIRNLGQLAMGGDSAFPMSGEAQPRQMPMPQRQPAPQQTNPQDYFYQGMIDRGIDPMFAKGLMPNIGDESGWSPDIQEHSPLAGRGGRGPYQLTGPRRDEFERRYGEDGYTWDNALDFLAYEVNGPEKASYQKIISNSATPQEAAANVVKHFLRPSKENQDRRVAKYLGKDGATMSSRNSPSVGRDFSDLDAREKELAEDPAVTKRQYWGAVLRDISSGLGDIGRGDDPDMGGFMAAFYARQDEAKRRLDELQSERRRREDMYTARDWQNEDQIESFDQQNARDEKLNTWEEAARERGYSEAEKVALRSRGWTEEDIQQAEDFRIAADDRADKSRREQTATEQQFTLGRDDRSYSEAEKTALRARGWTEEDIATAEQNKLAAEARGEERDIRAESRGEAKDIRAESRGEAKDIRTEGRSEMSAIRKESRGEEIKTREEQRALANEAAALDEEAQYAQELYGQDVPNAEKYYRIGGIDAVNDARNRTKATNDRRSTLQYMSQLSDANPENAVYKDMAEAMAVDPSLGFKDAFDMFSPKDDPAAVREFEFMNSLSEAGKKEFLNFKDAGATSFNMGDTVQTLGAKRAFEELGLEKEALITQRAAYEAYQTVATLMDAYPDGKLPTGAFEGLTVDARRYLADAGLLSPKGSLKVGLQTALNSFGSKLIGAIRIPGTGSTSDLEFKEFMRAIPNASKAGVTIGIMTQIGVNSYRYNSQVADLKEAYILEHGNTVGFDKAAEQAVLSGDLQATFYSTDNKDAMRAAAGNGNLKVGDMIQGPDGSFYDLTEEGYNALVEGVQ